MKKIFTLSFILALSTTIYAQKCKESVDPITNEKKVEYEYASMAGFYVKYEVANGKAILVKDFNYVGAINGTVPAGIEIIFKLENGEVLKLTSTKEAGPKMYASPYGVSTGYTFNLAVSKEELGKLAISPVVFMRIPKITEDGYFDLDQKNIVVKKTKKQIQKGAACIVSYL